MKIVSKIYFLTSLIGALLVASNTGTQLIGYILFLISSILGSYLVLKSNADRSLLWVNLMFGLINIVGIIRS